MGLVFIILVVLVVGGSVVYFTFSAGQAVVETKKNFWLVLCQSNREYLAVQELLGGEGIHWSEFDWSDDVGQDWQPGQERRNWKIWIQKEDKARVKQKISLKYEIEETEFAFIVKNPSQT